MPNPLNKKVIVYPNREAKKSLQQRANPGLDVLAERLARLSKDPVLWTQQVRRLKGDPFTFAGREYLLPIYRDPSKDIRIVKGRQTEITELAINWILYHLTNYPFTTAFYVTHGDEKVSSFSDVRMKQQGIKESPVLRTLLIDDGNVHHIPLPNGSHLYMYSGFKEFKMSRQFTIDWAVIDEAQDQELSALSVIGEAQSHSKYGRKLLIGTGSEEGSEWHKAWLVGDQKEWDARAKAWVAKAPENFNRASSYHLPQSIVPWIPAEDIEAKRREYPARLFTTEVDGWWFKGAKKPLIEQQIRALFQPTLRLLQPGEVDHNRGPLYMGVDWGGGEHTVYWIWQCIDRNLPRFQLVMTARLPEHSTEKQADQIAEVIDSYKIRQGVMDAGGGTRQVEKLSNRYATRMLRCSYMTRPENPVEFVTNEARVVVDRTWIIETIIDLITRPEPHPALPAGIPRVMVPSDDEAKVDWIIEQLTCIESEEVNLPSGKKYMRYVRPPQIRDDVLHANNYAYLAYLYDKTMGAGKVVNAGPFGGSTQGSTRGQEFRGNEWMFASG